MITLDPPAARYPNISPDTKLLAAAGNDGIVRLLDTDTGRVVRRLDGPRIAGAFAPVFNPDGSRLAVGNARGHVTVWDVASGHRLGRVVARGDGPAYGIFDPTDGTRLFTVGHDGTVARWDLRAPRHPRPVDLFTVPRSNVVARHPELRRLDRRPPAPGRRPVHGADLGVGPRWRRDAVGRPRLARPVRRRRPRCSRPLERGPGHGLGCGERPARRDADHGRGTPLRAHRHGVRTTARVAVTDVFTGRVRVLDVGTGQDVIPPITLHPSDSFARFLPDGRLFTASAERVVIVRPAPQRSRRSGRSSAGPTALERARRSPVTAAASSPSTVSTGHASGTRPPALWSRSCPTRTTRRAPSSRVLTCERP